jgi:hypothetical protein
MVRTDMETELGSGVFRQRPWLTLMTTTCRFVSEK